MPKISVLHLISTTGVFGAEQVVLNLCKNINGSSYHTIIAAFKDWRQHSIALLKQAENLGLDTVTINLNGRLDFKGVAQLKKIITDFNIDILHCHNYKANFYGVLATRQTHIPKVATVHSWLTDSLPTKIYEFFNHQILLFSFNKIIAVSDPIAQQMLKTKIPAEKIVVIHNGLDLDRFSNNTLNEPLQDLAMPRNYKVVGAVGRLIPAKGFNYFIQAAAEVIKKIPNTTFILVGDGPLREELEDYAKALHIKEKITFAGVQTDMQRIYQLMDVFVLSSVSEGLPMVVLEAMALKKPIVATNVGDVSKLIHDGETGLLVQPKDVTGLTTAILQLLANKQKGDELARNAQNLIRNEFSAKAMARKTEEVYEEILTLQGVSSKVK